MSQYLVDLIRRDVEKLPLDEWLADVRKNPRIDLGRPAAEVLREVRDERDAHWDAHFGLDSPRER